MRRSKEKLAVRLAQLRKLHARRLAGKVHQPGLKIVTRVVSGEDALFAPASVVDGLETFSARFNAEGCVDSLQDAKTQSFSTSLRILDVNLANDCAPVLDLQISEAQTVQVRQGGLIQMPRLRSGAVEYNPAVCALESFRYRKPEILDAGRFLVQEPPVRSADLISRIPHRRRSVNIGSLNDSERRGFLHEVEVLKHIPAERAELLAVFRHVPVEMISQMRFLSEQKEILYSIGVMPKRTYTRVHDVAAIRDKANQDVHIIAHRTRSRPVRLA